MSLSLTSSSSTDSDNCSFIQTPQFSSIPNNQRNNPQPRYLKDPTTLESISSAFTGISSYVRKSIPDGLLSKAFQLNPLSSSHPPIDSNKISAQAREKIINNIKPRSKVTYACFDYLHEVYTEERKLCLLLGYSDSFHIWEVDDINKLTEIALINFDGGEIKSLKIINPTPEETCGVKIVVGSVRFLPTTPKDSVYQRHEEVSFLSLYSLNENQILTQTVFEKETITSLELNSRCIVVATTLPSIRLLRRCDLSEYHAFDDVFTNPITRQPVFALGPRWIAYSTTSETPWKSDFQDPSGIVGKNVKVDRVAKDVVNGLKFIGDYGYQQINNYLKPNSELSTSPLKKGINEDSLDSSPTIPNYEDRGFPKNSGRVVIRDIREFLIGFEKTSCTKGSKSNVSSPSIAHFHCHYYPISNLAFNSSGNLLATSSVEGHTFYIFEIIDRQPVQPSYKLLYRLSRGYTDARVINMTFNGDSRWLATTTNHGTTHLFQINPYGGHPQISTHLEGRVVNPPTQLPTTNFTEGVFKPTSLAAVARFRRKLPNTENSESSNEEHVDQTQPISRIDDVCALHFPPSSTFLSKWLNKLPSSYDQSSLGSTVPRAYTVMLALDSEGAMMLLRLTVNKKQNPSSQQNNQEFSLVTQVERIAEWTLAKSPGDYEKIFEPRMEAADKDPSKLNSPKWEPESAWLPFVETHSYDPYISLSRPLWTLRQFDFKAYCDNSNSDAAQGAECFQKDQQKTRILEVRHQNLPRFFGRNEVKYQPSYGEIEDHLIHAMETKLDKPAMPKNLKHKKEALSFEDALEINMVHSSNTLYKNTTKQTLTEIPLSYAEEESSLMGYHSTEMEDDCDHLEVFAMDELDDFEYTESIESEPSVKLLAVDGRRPEENQNIFNSTGSRSTTDREIDYNSSNPSQYSVDNFLNMHDSYHSEKENRTEY